MLRHSPVLTAAGTLLLTPVPCDARITYLDVTPDNTTRIDGSPHTPTAALINDDDEWSTRMFGNRTTVYTSNDDNANPGEDAPALRTAIRGLEPGEEYAVRVYFWGAGNDSPTGNQRWDLRAGLAASELSFFDVNNSPNLGHAATGVDPAAHFANNSPPILLAEDDRRLHEAFLGNASADADGRIEVFIDDAPGNANRTWIDGIGHGPPVTPAPLPGDGVEIASSGVWTWFNDNQAIVLPNGRLLVGYVRADGRIAATNFDPETENGSEIVIGTGATVETDDHNNPSFTPLADGRIFAAYSRHDTDNHWFHRTSTTNDPRSASDFGPELQGPGMPRGNSYSNAFRLSAEGGRLYHFSRSINYNPTLTVSDDEGVSWSTPEVFIRTGDGSNRPYTRFSSNHHDLIDVIYTDGHPRSLENSLYHLRITDGGARHSDGTRIRALDSLPIRHDAPASERGGVIYSYSSAAWGPGQGPDDWIPNGRAWSWDVHRDADDRPVAVFSVQVADVTGSGWNHDRIYYYYARWTGSSWQRRFIAHAGRPLYSGERDYAGGICIDPDEPGVVYLSTNAADPFDLASLDDVPLAPSERYEIHRGVTNDGGLTFSWEEVTTESGADNIRPVVPEGHDRERALIWLNGTYNSYTSYSTRVLGVFGSPVTGSSFETWAEENGIAGQAFEGDANGDGISNGLAYALAGLDPLGPSGRQGRFSDGVLEFSKRPEAVANGDIEYVLEISPNLEAGSWVEAANQVDDTTSISLDLKSEGIAPVFARLRVTKIE